MQKIFRWIPVLLAGCLLFGAFLPSVQAKKPFVSQAGKFSAAFPGPPQQHQDNEKTFVGNIQVNIFQTKTKRGVFTVEYSQLPDIAVFFGGKKTIYDKAKRNFLKKTGSREIDFKEVTVSGYPGKELTFTSAKGHPGKARFILVDHQFYVVVGESFKGATVIDPFLNSFSVLP